MCAGACVCAQGYTGVTCGECDGVKCPGQSDNCVPTADGLGYMCSPFDLQCFAPYTTVEDAWRAISNKDGPGTNYHYQQDVDGLGGGNWYRFVGAGGDAIPLSTPGELSCGRSYPGWLSGWNINGGAVCTAPSGGTNDCPDLIPGNPASPTCDWLHPFDHPHDQWPITGRCGPPRLYKEAGHYPTAEDGVTEMTVCFHRVAQPCRTHVTVAVVRCKDFLLWRLPSTPAWLGREVGYCTANSSLVSV
eukprot:SAG25_NODE_1018_length_4280_cov_2.698158_2_plen_246_part_00